jgi:hypothetical protein
MISSQRLAPADDGFTVVGTLSSLAVAAAIFAICVPIVTRRVSEHAQAAQKAAARAESAIAGGLNALASRAEGFAHAVDSAQPYSQAGADGASPWPASPIDRAIPFPDGIEYEGCRPRWPVDGKPPPPYWRPRFRPHPLEWRLWQRSPAWR